jgi:phosphatidylglycerol---prolipoprotein diacylglyceryl transferase
MFPILLHIGPITLRTYGALVALAFLASLYLARAAARLRKIGESFLLDLAALLVITGLLGARIFYILLNLSYFRDHPAESFKVWEGGLVFYGGFLVAGVVGVIFTRYKGYAVSDVADAVAPSLALGHAIGRLGCFFAGCCYGKPATLPWAVQFKDPASLAPLGIALHPVQIYESLGSFLIAAFLWQRLIQKKETHGDVFWLYVLLYGFLRFFVEVFRGDERGFILGGLSPSQLIALLAILVAGSIFLVRVASRHDSHH